MAPPGNALRVRAAPGNCIALPTLALSSSPTVVDQGSAPRHVDLRPCCLVGGRVEPVPVGLTRTTIARLRGGNDNPDPEERGSILRAPAKLKVAGIVGNRMAAVSVDVGEGCPGEAGCGISAGASGGDIWEKKSVVRCCGVAGAGHQRLWREGAGRQGVAPGLGHVVPGEAGCGIGGRCLRRGYLGQEECGAASVSGASGGDAWETKSVVRCLGVDGAGRPRNWRGRGDRVRHRGWVTLPPGEAGAGGSDRDGPEGSTGRHLRAVRGRKPAGRLAGNGRGWRGFP